MEAWNNTTTAVPMPEPPFQPGVTGVFGFLAAIVSLATVLGNLLVITSFFVERNLRSATNYFIASLAVTDLLIGMFSMNLYTLYLLLGYWPMGRIICDLWLSLDYTACLTSQYTVFFITVDRFCSVKIPAKYRNWRTDRKVRVMVACTWIIPSSLFFTCIFGWRFFDPKTKVRRNIECFAEFLVEPIFNTTLTICYFWVTLIVMCGLYVGIFQVALNLARKSEAKQKKMTSLVSMAGQTMSRIGVGVTHAQQSDEDTGENEAVANYERSQEKEKKKTVTVINHQNCTKKQNKPNAPTVSVYIGANGRVVNGNCAPPISKPVDRSSSATFPSDSDGCGDINDSRLSLRPSPIEAPLPRPPALATIESPVLLDIPAANSRGQLNASSISDDSNRLACLEPSSIMFAETTFSLTDNTQVNTLHCTESTIPESQQLILSAPPYHFEGLKYIDQDSLKSNTSLENMRLLIDILPLFIPEESYSPVWKKQCSFAQAGVDSANNISEDCFTPLVHQSTPVDRSQAWQSRSAAGTRYVENVKKASKKLKSVSEDKSGKDVKDVSSKKSSRTENRARKAFKTITLILGAFIICWTPYHIFVLIKGLCDNPKLGESCVNDHLYSLSYWLCYLNSPINPFCYAFANVQFKKAFLRILRCNFRRT